MQVIYQDNVLTYIVEMGKKKVCELCQRKIPNPTQ